jgi:zinc/manganese transport system substrate-binding protein
MIALRPRLGAAATAAGLACLLLMPSARAATPGRIVVVAAENFYADVVGQIAGDHVALTSILSNPNIDPHEYETNARDAAAVANARLVIQNGLGYDTFIDRLLAASPNRGRKIIVVADLTGHHQGDNPHIWYDPATMPKVAQSVVEFLSETDPGSAASYRDWHRLFQVSLRPLTQKIATLKARYAGVPVAVTEPVFNYLGQEIGLNVLTPMKFQKAIEEGVDPPAAAVAQMEDQLRQHRVRVLLYNTQTVSPITTRVRGIAKQVGIPVVGVSETEPPGKSYQQWMLGQLEELEAALGQGK